MCSSVCMRKINEGAESKVYLARVFGKDIIVKSREPKRYRNEQLDLALRKVRTKKEMHAMLKAKNTGVNVPGIVASGMFTLYMQRIDGKLLKDVVARSNIFKQVGAMLAKLHNCGIAHGDFTPANIIISRGKAYVIDFGLVDITDSVEEKALDMLLMKRAVSSAQYKSFLSGYAGVIRNKIEVMGRLAEIERRGRYQVRTLT